MMDMVVHVLPVMAGLVTQGMGVEPTAQVSANKKYLTVRIWTPPILQQ